MSKIVTVSYDKGAMEKIGKDVVKAFQFILNRESVIKEIATTIIDDIRFQTIRGKSIVTGGDLKPLSKRWIKTRGDIIMTSPRGAHPAAKEDKSNLTLSGKLLDSMRYENKKNGRIRFYFYGDHAPYTAMYKTQYTRNRNGKTELVNTGREGVRTIGETIPNEKLADYVADQGRPFFGVRPKVRSRIQRIVVAAIRRDFKIIQNLRNK